jgi:cellulose synthase/poly-beta-1,6-N-acetylglucosamine synthase-like glycosyltransferase
MSGTLHLTLMCLFWAALALLVYTFVGYPVWIYLSARLHSRSWRQEPILPTVSVVLAVHNGATLVRRQIRRLLLLDYPSYLLNIIVVSDGSTDGTDEILSSIRHPSVKIILWQERRGKAAAVNAGLQSAKGEVVLFVDIRPRPARNSLRLLVSNFADPSIGCVTGDLILRDESHTPGAKAVSGLYWRYEQWIRECESQVDSLLGVYGGFYAVRRELTRPLPEATILDDMLQPLSVIRQGYRSVIDGRARVYDVWPKSLQVEFKRKVRTLAGHFQLLQLAPWLLSRENRVRFELVSHRLLRLLVPVLLVILLATSTMLAIRSRLYGALLATQLFLYMSAALGAWCGLPILVRIAGASRAFCMMNVAVVMGFYKFLFTRGPLWNIWIPTVPFAGVTPDDDDEATQATAGV